MAQSAALRLDHEGMAFVASGSFVMGSDRHYPEEAPAHRVAVDGFWMDVTPVTNAAFKRFVDETGYVTVAERPPEPALYPGAKPELLAPGSAVFFKTSRAVDLRDCSQWWQYILGASWQHPEGPESSLEGRLDHPVVHVAYEDALAYAAWAKKILPSEAEWEHAARGGLEAAEYAWGDEFSPNGKVMANTWRGEFPWKNERTDGLDTTSPVIAYPPNGYGLYDMTGNVWEWTSDWYQARRPNGRRGCCSATNPRGGTMIESFDPLMPDVRIPRKVLKGGSFLCAPNYCLRYRPAARIPQTIDTSTCHIGFRCIRRERGRP